MDQHNEPRSRVGVTLSSYRTVQTDQSGRFSLEGLVPAEYRVCDLTDHEPGRESELDYLISLERGSERINLSPGQTVEESLVALPAVEGY